jgi:hypothetical protein
MTKGAPTLPRVIAHKSSATRNELLVQPEAYFEFQQQAHLNEAAGDDQSLYPSCQPCSHRVLGCPKQMANRLMVLRAAFGSAGQKTVQNSGRVSGSGFLLRRSVSSELM